MEFTTNSSEEEAFAGNTRGGSRGSPFSPRDSIGRGVENAGSVFRGGEKTKGQRVTPEEAAGKSNGKEPLRELKDMSVD